MMERRAGIEPASLGPLLPMKLAVAIGAENVALGYFGINARHRPAHVDELGNSNFLLASVTMVEV